MSSSLFPTRNNNTFRAENQINNFTNVLLAAQSHGLHCTGVRSGLIYFEEPSTGSTLAIEADGVSVDALLSMIYRWQYRCHTAIFADGVATWD